MAEKLTIVGSLEPKKLYKKGDTFEGEWPLHVTMMPWFTLKGDRTDFEQSVGDAMQYFGPQEIVGGKEDMFGPDHDIRVRLLKNMGRLAGMHDVIMANVKKQEGRFRLESLHHVGDGYVPHATYQGEYGLEHGERAKFDRLQLVRGDISGPRTVISSFPLLGKKRG